MKRFNKLKSGITINKIEERMNAIKQTKKELSKIEVPKVDIIAKAECEKKVSQYIINEEIKNTDFIEIEDVIEKYIREIEIKRVDNKVIYTLIEENIKVEGTADLSLYSYENAVMMAKLRALVELNEKKMKEIIQATLVERAKKATEIILKTN